MMVYILHLQKIVLNIFCYEFPLNVGISFDLNEIKVQQFFDDLSFEPNQAQFYEFG